MLYLYTLCDKMWIKYIRPENLGYIAIFLFSILIAYAPRPTCNVLKRMCIKTARSGYQPVTKLAD